MTTTLISLSSDIASVTMEIIRVTKYLQCYLMLEKLKGNDWNKMKTLNIGENIYTYKFLARCKDVYVFSYQNKKAF